MHRVGQVSDDEIDEINAWLARNGFSSFAHEERPDHFGDEFTEWSRGLTLVRTVRDSGQSFVDVARAGWNDWFDIDLVTWVLNGKPETVVDRVADAAAAEENLDRLRPVLVSVREETSRRSPKQGFPPRHNYDR